MKKTKIQTAFRSVEKDLHTYTNVDESAPTFERIVVPLSISLSLSLILAFSAIVVGIASFCFFGVRLSQG